jgi:methylenetetrahydrofolate reductase (NADPH)
VTVDSPSTTAAATQDRPAAPPLSEPTPAGLHVSFEFFPPKTDAQAESLWTAVKRLEPLAPRFVSVTYGAGGSTRERTEETVLRIAHESSLTAATHLTCVGATREQVDAVAQRFWDAGIRHIVALRGDSPESDGVYRPTPGGYAFAADLVAGLKRLADFEISVAAYPEVHPEAANAQADLDALKRKIDAGASRAITQFFFDVDVFRRFRDRAAAAGITVPLVPGILPVVNFATVKRFAGLCNAHVPAWMHDLFGGLEDDAETRKLMAGLVAAEQARTLAADGVEEMHFYTLNRADLTLAVCHALGIRAPAAAAS